MFRNENKYMISSVQEEYLKMHLRELCDSSVIHLECKQKVNGKIHKEKALINRERFTMYMGRNIPDIGKKTVYNYHFPGPRMRKFC